MAKTMPRAAALLKALGTSEADELAAQVMDVDSALRKVAGVPAYVPDSQSTPATDTLVKAVQAAVNSKYEVPT